ncbi:hypothetical protein DSECCO2_444560 [anaerobic digester metagenome]
MPKTILVIFVSLLWAVVSCKHSDLNSKMIGAWYINDGYVVPNDEFLDHQSEKMPVPMFGFQKGFFFYPDGKVEVFNGFWQVNKDKRYNFLGNIGSWEIRNDSLIIIDPLQNEKLKRKIIKIDEDTLFLSDNGKQANWVRFRPTFHQVDFDSLHLNYSNGWNIRYRFSLFPDGKFNLSYVNDLDLLCTGQINSVEMKNISVRLSYSDILSCSREVYSTVVDGPFYTFTIYNQGKILKKIIFSTLNAPMKTTWAILYVYNILQQHSKEICDTPVIRPLYL